MSEEEDNINFDELMHNGPRKTYIQGAPKQKETVEKKKYYDEMDYDDELNDEEEKDYKKELVGSDASEEGEEEMEEESEESIVPEPKVLP